MRKFLGAAAIVAAAAASLMITADSGASVNISDSRITPPDGMTASFLVIDRKTGAPRLRKDEHRQYRSASLVKLLIALDYLETRGPNKEIPPEDRVLLEPMLRSSNDDAASTLWVRGGQQEIIHRMVAKIGLQNTERPHNPGMWGYTAISASDVAKIYEYILDEAHPRFRRFLMSNLHRWTTCGSDGFDQSFGIPSAVSNPGAIKQGWSGFNAHPAVECEQSSRPDEQRALNSPEVARARTVAPGEDTAGAPADVDLIRPAMHTSGTVGEKIMVVLTLEPKGTSWNDCATRITALTGAIARISDELD
jgi:hypothetical protein